MVAITQFSLGTLGIKTDQEECLRCDMHCQQILQRMFFREDLCDVVFIVGQSQKRIEAHRLILIASSKYFSDLFSEPMFEDQQVEITFNNVDVGVMEKLITYCYTGYLDIKVDTIVELLTTANHLRLERIVEGCCEFLQRHLQPSNCLAVAFLAEQLYLEELLHKSQQFIRENFEEVSNQADFFLLDVKHLSEFMASDELVVRSEEVVFEILMKWIEYEPESRWEHFTQLLDKVRLSLLPPYFLCNKVEPLCNVTETQKLFIDAIKSHHMCARNGILHRRYTSKNVQCLLAIYKPRLHEKDNTLIIASYNLWSKMRTICNTPIKCGDRFGVALLEDNLITVNSSLKNEQLKTVTSLDLNTMSSSEMMPLQTFRNGPAVAVLNGTVYVLGGIYKMESLNSVERWDPIGRKWNFVSSMSINRGSPGVVAFKNILYVSGGYTLEKYSNLTLSSVECYNPVDNIWRSIAPMKVARRCHCFVPFKGYLFAIGGHNAEQVDLSVERYDPSTDTWTTIPCSPYLTGYTAATSLGSDIFIYNKSSIYMIQSECSCEHLELRQIVESMNICSSFSNYELQLVAIPYEFSPPEHFIYPSEKF